jgi:hypothetical protein
VGTSCSIHTRRRNASLDWSQDPEEEGRLEDLGGRWEDNCKIYLKRVKVGWFEQDSFG